MRAKVRLDAIKRLRDETGAPVGDVRSALEAADGDEAKARALLKQRGAQVANKRQGRATGQGRIEAYIHHDGRLGALVEVNCESDFVARTDEFRQLCKDLAMQVAAMEASDVDGLMKQPFVKDAGTTIGDLLKALMAKTGEKVVIKRFMKFALGDSAVR